MKKLPKWIKAIPESQAHGSGTYQKRLWRLVSDFVRVRDWYKYHKCVATGKYIEDWKSGHAGHFISYSKCNGMFKFCVDNIFLQSPHSNAFGDYDDWIEFEHQINLRGIDTDELRAKNRDTELKINDFMISERMLEILEMMKDLKEQPGYYKRVMELI